MARDGLERTGILKTSGTLEFILPDKNKIKRILRAYGNLDPEVGYKQGFPNIVTLLLHYISPEPSSETDAESQAIALGEEDVFFCLFRIMHSLNWREHYLKPYTRNTYLVKELDSLISFHLPRLHA